MNIDPTKNHPSNSDFFYGLAQAVEIARRETAELERFRHVKTPQVEREGWPLFNLRHVLRQAKTVVVEALGR